MSMRKILLSLSCFATLYAEQMYLYEVSPIIGLSENGNDTGLQRSVAYGIQLQYNDIDFLIKPELTYIFSPNIEVYENQENVNGHLLMLNGVYDLEYTALLTPFLKAGIGYQSVSDVPSSVNSDAFVAGAGAGLKLHVADNIAIKFETTLTTLDFSANNILVFAGLNFAFGNESNEIPVQEPIIIEHNTTVAQVEENTTIAPIVILPPEPIYISKADHNLTEATPSKQEVVERDVNNHLTSLTLFVPYHFRSFNLDDESTTILINYAKELQTTNDKVLIIGHTDTKGRRAFNKELSLKRAEVVKALFVEYGVNPERITIEGHGESEPIADKNNPTANYLNKRIEIKILKPSQKP